jgi:hypothetical protein
MASPSSHLKNLSIRHVGITKSRKVKIVSLEKSRMAFAYTKFNEMPNNHYGVITVEELKLGYVRYG